MAARLVEVLTVLADPRSLVAAGSLFSWRMSSFSNVFEARSSVAAKEISDTVILWGTEVIGSTVRVELFGIFVNVSILVI